MEGKAAFGTLCFYCSFLRGGYSLLASPHAFADEVTIDTAAPSTSPYGTDRYYAGVSITGNAAGHKLIVDNVDIAGYVTGGWAMGATGDATNNTVELKGNARVNSTISGYGVFGGRSEHGKAINNTVILNGKLNGAGYTNLYGGWSGKTGATAADNTAGNTLQVKTKDNVVYSINNFEKMSFVLGNGISSGDTLLTTHSLLTPQKYDWNNIKVLGGETWGTGDDAAKRVILYKASYDVELTNYAVSGTTEGNWEYGLTTDETTTAATPGATTVNAKKSTLIGTNGRMRRSPLIRRPHRPARMALTVTMPVYRRLGIHRTPINSL